MLVFRRKYPRWWFDFNRELVRFSARVAAYAALLTDRYPSTDSEQDVHLQLPEPDAAALNRWLPLVKWLLAVPHYIVLAFLYVGVAIAVVIAWFAILFTGRRDRHRRRQGHRPGDRAPPARGGRQRRRDRRQHFGALDILVNNS
jgi:hypothetical protein